MKNEKQQPKTKNILNFILLLCVFSFVFYAFDSNTTYAQSLNLTSSKTSYNVGDSFLVSLSINTKNKPINTISGTIKVSPDKLRITDVRYGNSIITLWVERPKINALAGTITFAGGVPGGFNGSSGPILSFILKTTNIGSAPITLDNFNVLLNDGLGTVLSNVALNKLSITISKAPPPAPKKEEPKGAESAEQEVYVPPPDAIPPESFVPTVSRNPGVEGNKYFVSFFAVDKDSGIARYEATEKPLILSYFTSRFDTPWTITESPYIIAHQYLTREILVRAYDQAGNLTEESVLKPIHPALLWIFIGFWTLIVVGASYFYFKPRVRSLKRKIGKRAV